MGPVQMGGDPIFHNGDQWLKFALKAENELIPILSWTQPSGRNYTLLGSVFSSRMKGKDQWFNKIALQTNGETVLSAEVGTPENKQAVSKTMAVRVEGQAMKHARMQGADGKFNVTLHERPFKPPIGENKAERLRLNLAHGYELEISSAAAVAFPKHPDMQERWAHLNLHFSALPDGATGLLAELAGLRPQSEETRMLIVQHKPSHSPLREHGVSLRRKSPQASSTCPTQCPGCPFAWNCEVMADAVDLLNFWADENSDFLVEADEFEKACKNDKWLSAVLDVDYPNGCADFTAFVYATCDMDDSGDINGCEGLICMELVENDWRETYCPAYPAASVASCTANDCILQLKPEYAELYPSFKDCKPHKEPFEHLWRRMDTKDRAHYRMRNHVERNSHFKKSHIRKYFQAVLDNKNNRNIV